MTHKKPATINTTNGYLYCQDLFSGETYTAAKESVENIQKIGHNTYGIVYLTVVGPLNHHVRREKRRVKIIKEVISPPVGEVLVGLQTIEPQPLREEI